MTFLISKLISLKNKKAGTKAPAMLTKNVELFEN
tara:strand:+ start:338 stop:439 length:102 start_codon:yes stop_codon:yes gene_type:complete